MPRPLSLVAVVAILAFPGAAGAAPAKISPHPSAVSEAGRATIEAANPNSHALRGTAGVIVGGKEVAQRPIRLRRRSVTTIVLRFDARARTALREARGRATITLRLRRSGRPAVTLRRRVTLRIAGVQAAPVGRPPLPAPDGDTGAPDAPVPTPPTASRWVGRMGAEGPYDDLELTVAGGHMEIARVPTVPVFCFENGGAFRSALSLEIFDAPGPWTLGRDDSIAKQGMSVNQLVGSSTRTLTYKVTGTSMAAGHIAGTLGMSFFDSKYDPFNNTMTYINCAGSQSFEAVPAA